MKFEMDINSDEAQALVIAWLKDYRDICIAGAKRQCDTVDYIRTVNAIDEILKTSMTKEEWDAYRFSF